MDKNEQQLPRLGEPVPAFEAMTTQGKVSFPADYKGKWVILFSHPADFTPICTSEVLTFGARTAEFKALNCELIGLSVDSRNSHIAWLRTIREKIEFKGCLLYTSGAADERSSGVLGGRRITKKKNTKSRTHTRSDNISRRT